MVLPKVLKTCRIYLLFKNYLNFYYFIFVFLSDQGLTRRRRMDLVFLCLEMTEEVYLLSGQCRISIRYLNTKFRFLYPSLRTILLSGSLSLRTIYSIRFSQHPNYIFCQVLPTHKLYILSGSSSLRTIYSVRFFQPPNYIFYQVLPALKGVTGKVRQLN